MDLDNIAQIEKLSDESLRDSRELRMKSLTQWAYLSGGTITLLVPFTQSLHKIIVWGPLLVVAGVLLLLALVSNSLGLYIVSKTRYHYMLELKNSNNKFEMWYRFNQYVDEVGILLYILGLSCAAVFVGINIL